MNAEGDTAAEKTLESISEILWPADDPGREWTSDTIEIVAEIVRRAGYGPYTDGPT